MHAWNCVDLGLGPQGMIWVTLGLLVVDCPTQLICTWIFICSTTTLKRTQQGNLRGCLGILCTRVAQINQLWTIITRWKDLFPRSWFVKAIATRRQHNWASICFWLCLCGPHVCVFISLMITLNFHWIWGTSSLTTRYHSALNRSNAGPKAVQELFCPFSPAHPAGRSSL